MPNKARPTMERRRLSFPSTDTTVRDWLSAQSDPSASMRLIIRDTVAREGYSDVMCRRVEQQPQRGRPRAAATMTATGAEQSENEVRVDLVPPSHVPEHPVTEDAAQQSQLEQARLRQHPEPVNQALQGSQVQVDQVSASPSSDVEDFFSAMRP